MTFKMWSLFHWFYIIIPIVACVALYFALRNKSNKLKWAFAYAFAVINIGILIVRNVDIFVRSGMDAELIPLGPCHFANIVYLVAVFKKNQTWFNLAWCLNLPFGAMAILFANSLENYATLLRIRPMTYLWGHFFLVVSIVYVFIIGITNLNTKTFVRSMLFALGWLVVCIATSIIYNLATVGSLGFANYMYMIKPEGGTPMDIIYGLVPQIHTSNMSIDPLYMVILSVFGIVLFYIFHVLHQSVKFKRLEWKLNIQDVKSALFINKNAITEPMQSEEGTDD